MKYTRTDVYRHFNQRVSFSKRGMLACAVMALLMTGVSLIMPYLYKILVDEVMAEGHIRLLYTIIPAMIVVYISKAALSALNTFVSKKFVYRTNLETKKQLMTKLLSKSMSQISEDDVGAQSNNIESDSVAVSTFLSKHVVGFITSLIITFIYMGMMLAINLWLGLISVILLPLSLLVSHIIGQKFNDINRRTYEVQSKTRTYVFDTVQKWREIKSNTLEDQFADQYDRMLEPERRLNSKWMIYYALKDLFYLLKDKFVMKVLLYFIGGLFVLSKEISIGYLLIFINYMEGMSTSLDAIMQSKTDFLGQKAQFDRIFTILDEPVQKEGEKCPDKAIIALKNIDFTYNGTENKVFENLSCEFLYGKKYLIVGKSGEGKSTLIKMLLGINQPQKGCLTFNDIPSDRINSSSLLQNVGVVMQDNAFFNLSIRENLLLLAPEATEDELYGALKIACLDSFVDSLPQKLDTVIGERGVKLSGGQKQRLAIARLILHNPQTVIFDEATSALDSVVESSIMGNLNATFRDKTMIVISHKPLVNYCEDYVYVVENKNIHIKNREQDRYVAN